MEQNPPVTSSSAPNSRSRKTWFHPSERVRRRGDWLLHAFLPAISLVFLVIHAFIIFTSTLQAYFANYITSLTLGGALLANLWIILLYIFGLMQRRNRLGVLLQLIGILITGIGIFLIFRHLTTYILAQFIWGVIALFGIFGIIIGLLGLLIISVHEVRRWRSYLLGLKTGFKTAGKASWGVGLCLVACLSLSMGLNQRSVGIPITITPQNYSIQFRMWGNYYPEWYQAQPNGTQILDQLNRYNVTIQDAYFLLRDANNCTESLAPTVNSEDANKCVTALRWFAENYPYICFQYYAQGIGFDSAGNYEGSIYTGAMVKRFVDVCRNYSLPNVVGVYTDWEGPNNDGSYVSNETLNGWHQAMWADAMAYARTYFPNWTFSCCFKDAVLWDPVDGDPDLQYYYRYNIFTPPWDDYGPMVYRSCDVAGTMAGSSNYEGSWMIYANAYALLHGTLHDDLSKATMWLGCTGCGPYYNDTTVYEGGQLLPFGESTGFDSFVQDILILKSFGYPSVSIFLANQGVDAENPYPKGFFDQFGYADALDRLNTLVNGPNSTHPFTIWSEGNWYPRDPVYLDLMLNFNQFTYLPLAVAFVCVGLVATRRFRKTMKPPK